ncbi:MAG: sigma-70 family RNA polymerase sigma factor [Pirellulaceae bacterium]|nr:sigma-70 family RNA polymerase sigma factor [Pirellulaceae bacterium]
MTSNNFHTTQWTIVRGAHAWPTEHRRIALSQLCQTYWMPLYVYLRRSGYSDSDAEDFVQGYFEQLLSKDYLKSVDSAKGRFRSFLLVSLKHFVGNQHARDKAFKRGGHVQTGRLNFESAERWYQLEPAKNATADKLFDRRWALTLMDLVMSRLRERFVSQGRAELFDQLQPHLVRDPQRVAYTQIASELNCTVESLKSTMHRIKGWYRELLIAEISKTTSPEEVDDELNNLLKIISEKN